MEICPHPLPNNIIYRKIIKFMSSMKKCTSELCVLLFIPPHIHHECQKLWYQLNGQFQSQEK